MENAWLNEEEMNGFWGKRDDDSTEEKVHVPGRKDKKKKKNERPRTDGGRISHVLYIQSSLSCQFRVLPRMGFWAKQFGS